MDTFFTAYLAFWVACCVAALVLFARDRRAFVIGRREYWRFLAEPWKLVTFTVAAVGLAVVAPYTGDHTWDYVDATFMSVFTYTTAPWAVGTIYLALRGKESLKHAFVAACAWMFSTSWSYDAYILLKSGAYPATWWSNILLSGVMYVCAGLMWSLVWKPGRGVTFGFLEEDWPQAPMPGSFARIFWFALPFAVLVSLCVLPFLLGW